MSVRTARARVARHREDTRGDSAEVHRVTGRPSERSTPSEGGTIGTGRRYVAYDPGPDTQVMETDYGIDGQSAKARTLQRLEAEYGRDRVQRWADEGLPVKAMGKPRDMAAYREDRTEPHGSAPAAVGQRSDASDGRNRSNRRGHGSVGGGQRSEGTAPHRRDGAPGAVGKVSPERILRRLRRDDIQLLDVRSSKEYREGHIPGALNVPESEIASGTSQLDGNDDVAVYCRSGRRSRLAAREIAERNRDSTSAVVTMTDGFRAWSGDRSRGSRPSEHSPAGEDSPKCGCGHRRELGTGEASSRFSAGAGLVQTRFEVSHPADRYEREARRIADRVMRMSVPETSDSTDRAVGARVAAGKSESGRHQLEEGTDEPPQPLVRPCPRCLGLRRANVPVTCTECESGGQNSGGVLRSASSLGEGNGTIGRATERKIRTVQSGGQPLGDSVRSFFEPRFGRDFSDVRVHTGPKADEAARSINAAAFTSGRHVTFAKGNYEPGSFAGKKLIAHELAHVVQQGVDGGRIQRAPAEGSAGSTEVITVSRGDTLSGIAQEARKRFDGFDGTYQDLWAFNRDHMRSDDPDLIYPGEEIHIPVRAAAEPETTDDVSDTETAEESTTPEEESDDEDVQLVATLCHRPFRVVQNHVTAENRALLREKVEEAADWVPFVGEDEVDSLMGKVWEFIEDLADQARHCFVWLHPAAVTSGTPQTSAHQKNTFTFDTSTNGCCDEGALGSDVVCTRTFVLDDPNCIYAGYASCDTDDYNLGLFNCCSCSFRTLENYCGVSTAPGDFPAQNQGIGLPDGYGSGLKREIVEIIGHVMEGGEIGWEKIKRLYDYFF